MEKSLGKEYANSVQRENYLKDNCNRAEQKGYMRPFTPEELQGCKENQYFAVLAMQGLLSGEGINDPETVAKNAVAYADALLGVLVKKH